MLTMEKHDLKKHNANVVVEKDDEFMYHYDLMSWACTSSYFRNLLAPYVFKSVKLRNDDKSGESVTALLKGPYGVLVKELYFIGTIPPEAAKDREDESVLAEGFKKHADETGEEESAHRNITLPPTVSTTLSDLRQFPNLEVLSMGFTYP